MMSMHSIASFHMITQERMGKAPSLQNEPTSCRVLVASKTVLSQAIYLKRTGAPDEWRRNSASEMQQRERGMEIG